MIAVGLTVAKLIAALIAVGIGRSLGQSLRQYRRHDPNVCRTCGAPATEGECDDCYDVRQW